MAEDTRDTLMILYKGKRAIDAESVALIDGSDTLAAEFRKTKVTKDGWKGSFFSLIDFQLQVGMVPDASDDPAEDAKLLAKKDRLTQKQIKFLMDAQKNAAQGKPPMAGQGFNQYPRFMTYGPASIRQKSYTTDLEPVQFSKQMDITSITLFEAAANCRVFDSAIIIKRRGVGLNLLRTYLQIRFTDVLITDFNWEEDDVPKETIKFVCRKAEVQYSMEQDSGEMSAPLPVQTWSVLNLKN